MYYTVGIEALPASEDHPKGKERSRTKERVPAEPIRAERPRQKKHGKRLRNWAAQKNGRRCFCAHAPSPPEKEPQRSPEEGSRAECIEGKLRSKIHLERMIGRPGAALADLLIGERRSRSVVDPGEKGESGHREERAVNACGQAIGGGRHALARLPEAVNHKRGKSEEGDKPEQFRRIRRHRLSPP